MTRPRAIVYVDGFNLYRRALSAGQHKWLDLVLMSELLFKDHDIIQVRYFTALVKHQPHDPAAPQRQQTYLRALAADSRVSIHLGQFRIDKRDMPLHPLQLGPDGLPVRVRVRKAEEKGSDVNLASYMLLDATREQADLYVVVSNDSDLAEPARLLVAELGVKVGLVTPAGDPSRLLLSSGPQVIRRLRHGLLEASQLPPEIRDDRGVIRRPSEWKAETPDGSGVSQPVAEASGGVASG